MAKRTPPKSFPRSRKRSRSGSASLTLTVLAAAAAGLWFALGEAGILPAPWDGTESTQTAEAPSETSAEPAGPMADPPNANGDIVGTASVIDADTLDIHGERIRLVGIDAPESGQKCRDASAKFVRCGNIAANALDQWINRNPVTCVSEGKDRYQRVLGKCSVRGQSVQEWLVENGHAVAYRDYSTEFVPAEDRARTAKAGIWAGEFVIPSKWRKGERLPGEKAGA